MKKHNIIIETKEKYYGIVKPILNDMVDWFDNINPFSKPITLLKWNLHDINAPLVFRFECPEKMVDKFNETFDLLNELGTIECVCYEGEILKDEVKK